MVTKNFLATDEINSAPQVSGLSGPRAEDHTADSGQIEEAEHESVNLEQAQADIKMLRRQLMIVTNRLTVLEIACQENKRRFREHIKKDRH